MPDRLQWQAVTSLVPYCARKVPEVDGLAVRDEEGLAIDALRVKRNSGEELVRAEKSKHCQNVSKGYVLNVREVEQVVVIADLVFGLAILVCLYHLGKQLYISLTENTCRANGAGEEAFWLTVRFKNGCLSVGPVCVSRCFGWCSIASLPWWWCSTLAVHPQSPTATPRWH